MHEAVARFVCIVINNVLFKIRTKFYFWTFKEDMKFYGGLFRALFLYGYFGKLGRSLP